jgi:hypothetical protein
VLQDGRYVGLVALDEQVKLILDEPDDWDYDNVTERACKERIPEDPAVPEDPKDPTKGTVPLPSLLKCTTATLVDGSKTYLWADDLRFGPKLHDRFGELAERRAERNPF